MYYAEALSEIGAAQRPTLLVWGQAFMIAYLPARGGSKRIPRKNIRPLGGKPIILHVIQTLQRLPFVEQVCVSTDDPEIKECVEAHGAVTLQLRTAELASDTATLVSLVRHDVERFYRHCGIDSGDRELLVVLPTAALLSTELLADAFARFQNSGKSLLCSTTSFAVSPYRALVGSDADGWRPLHADMLMVRSQDLPEARVDVGMFYFMKYEQVTRHEGHWFTVPGGMGCYPVPEAMACDVDTPEDWSRLESLYNSLLAGRVQ